MAGWWWWWWGGLARLRYTTPPPSCLSLGQASRLPTYLCRPVKGTLQHSYCSEVRLVRPVALTLDGGTVYALLVITLVRCPHDQMITVPFRLHKAAPAFSMTELNEARI